MSILIEGMEMPKDGSMIFAIRPDGMVEDVMGCYVGKAVPVPPHGRLGDLDALIKANERSYDHFKNGDEISVQESTIAYLWASEIIRNAPTIIPAEEGEA